MALLLLFAGLAVVSMRAMSQGATLNEGTIRFETLLRFARAESAYLGKRVRVDFVQDTNLVASLTAEGALLKHVQLSWEPNPASQPGVFQDLTATRWGLDQVNETVGVETVRLTDSAGPEPLGDASGELAPTALSLDETAPPAPSCITFNPDGSCDSAEITLAARESEDTRRVIVQLEGFTGSVSHREPVAEDPSANGSPTNELGGSLTAVAESAVEQ